MTDRFDYGDPKGLDFELDLPSAPAPRAAKAHTTTSHAEELPELPAEFMDLPEELTAPFAEPAPSFPESAAWSLELEEIGPPVVTPSLASAPRANTPVRAATPISLPQPASVPYLHAPPVRTIELRIAQAVDRMSPAVRGGLLALTMVGMLLLATSVLMAGVRSALHTVERMRAEGDAAEAAARLESLQGATPEPDPYEDYHVEDVVDVDDDGRHLPQD